MQRMIIQRQRVERRGATAIIAMLYLVLFSSLAVGFVAATQTAVQVAYNDDSAQRAMLAAESGMEFIRYHLQLLNIDKNTEPDDLLDIVYEQLGVMLNGSPNLGGASIAMDDDTIQIPANTSSFVQINDATGQGKFRAWIQRGNGNDIRVSVVGVYKDSLASARGIQLDYHIEQKSGELFDFGVGSKGPIVMRSNVHIRGLTDQTMGSMLTTTSVNPAVSMGSGSEVSGQIVIADEDGRITYSSNAMVGGYPVTSPEGQASIIIGADTPQFPYVDTSIFAPFATNVLSTPNATYDGYLSNIRIKANTNPTFDSSSIVEGVIYVETPNRITFGSSMTMRGVVAVQNEPTGDLRTNTITFRSNARINGLETLDPVRFPELSKLGGCAILAPNFDVTINSNFGSVGGMIVAGQITLDSNASGTVTGGFLTLTDNAPLTFASNTNIIVKTPATNAAPPGLYFDSAYYPTPSSYDEFRP